MALDGLEQATKNSLISLMDMLGGDVEEQKHTKSMIVSTIEGMIKELMADKAKHKADKHEQANVEEQDRWQGVFETTPTRCGCDSPE